MGHRDIMPVDHVRGLHMRPAGAIKVCYQLMTEQVEVHPLGAAAPFGTTKKAAVERTRRGEVMDRNGDMKRG